MRRSESADLFRHRPAEHELVSGEVVLTARRDALTGQLKLPAATIDDILQLLRDRQVDLCVCSCCTRDDVLVTVARDFLDAAEK